VRNDALGAAGRTGGQQGLAELERRLPGAARTRREIRKIEKGEVGANATDVLLMDEPCSALDPIATAKIEELMLELKNAVPSSS